jgi:hypothetical protein
MTTAMHSSDPTAELLLICPDSKRIFRLSEAIRGPLRIDPLDPAEIEVDAWGEYDLRRAAIKVATDTATSQIGDARSSATDEVLLGLPEGLSNIVPSNLRWLGGKTWIHFRGMELKTQAEITVEIINSVNGSLDCSTLRRPQSGINLSAMVYRMKSVTNYEVRVWDPSLTEDWTKEKAK